MVNRYKKLIVYWQILTYYSQSGYMRLVFIPVTVRVVMVLKPVTVRTVMFVWWFYLLQPLQWCMCGFHAVTGRIFNSVWCLYCYSQDSYVCLVFLPVTARTIMTVLCSYLLQQEQLCLYGILQEGWACNWAAAGW
jgi:hypothetical protein